MADYCLDWQLHRAPGMPASFVSIVHNDGSYRFPGGFNLPGAHGYSSGLGSLTHTAYHYLDFLAFLIEQVKAGEPKVTCRRVFLHKTGMDYGLTDQRFRKLLGGDPNTLQKTYSGCQ